MTCLENVMLGCHCKYNFDILGTWLRIPFTSSKQEKEIKRKSLEMLAIARAMMANPEIIIMIKNSHYLVPTLAIVQAIIEHGPKV